MGLHGGFTYPIHILCDKKGTFDSEKESFLPVCVSHNDIHVRYGCETWTLDSNKIP